MPLVIPTIEGLAPYEGGKPIEELAREFGITDAVKLASNENPLGPSPRAVEAARRVITDAHRYPDGAAYDLRSKLAAKHGVVREGVYDRRRAKLRRRETAVSGVGRIGGKGGRRGGGSSSK